MNGRTIPVLPVRSTRDTKHFYEQLGFRDVGRPEWSHEYLVVRAGDVELHFFQWPDLEPENSSALCHIRVENADELHGLWSPLGLPEEGIPRMTRVADTPWGVRQFALVDPDGNCISCGQQGERARWEQDKLPHRERSLP